MTTRYTREKIAANISRLLNAALMWTDDAQGAVASVDPTKRHRLTLDVNQQEFIITVSVPKPETPVRTIPDGNA